MTTNLMNRSGRQALVPVLCLVAVFLLLGAGLFPSTAQAAIAPLAGQDWPATPQIDNTTAGSATANFTPAAGTDRLVLINVQAYTANTTATTITVDYGNGTNWISGGATLIVSSDSAQRRQSWLFSLDEAAIAAGQALSPPANQIMVTNNNTSGTGAGWSVFIATLGGVDQLTPVNGSYGYYNNNNVSYFDYSYPSTNVGLAALANGYAVAGMNANTNTVPTNNESYTSSNATNVTIGSIYGRVEHKSFTADATTNPTFDYGATFRGGIAAATFNPNAADTTPPQVQSTSPVTGATGVTIDSPVTITWNENVDCTTVTTSSVTISGGIGWGLTSCSGAQAVFTPSGEAGSTGYTVTVGTGVTDVAGNPMAASYPFSFTTAAPTVPNAPTGLSVPVMHTTGPELSWNSSAGATQYNVYRSTDNATWGAAVGTVSAPVTAFTDTTAPVSNTNYYWTVSAQNVAGESAKATSVSGRTALLPGYNMVSAPYDTTSQSPTAVFGGWAYWGWIWQSSGSTNPDNSGSYVRPADIVPGTALFLWAWDDMTVASASGAANPASVAVTLVPGWNMVAATTATAMTNIGTNWMVDGTQTLDQAVTANVIGGALSWWNGNTYDTLTISGNPTIEPWKGYFILNMTAVNHTLTIQ